MELNEDVVPRTLHECVGLILGSLSDEDREFIRSSKELVEVHHTLGRYLRNNWSLWDRDLPLTKWFREELKIWHADDMSGLILHGVYSFVRGRLPNYAGEVERYHHHWACCGLNPYTGEPSDGETREEG